MAFTHDGRAVEAVYGATNERTSVADALWTGVYAVLALSLTALGVAGAAYLATTLTTGPGATGLLLAVSIAAFAAGPVLARSLVRALHDRLAGRTPTPGRTARSATESARHGAETPRRDAERPACA